MNKIIVIFILLILSIQIVSSKKIYSNEQYDFLIITPDEFKLNFAPLKEHKENKGIQTKIIGLQEIYDGIYFPLEGRDKAEQIKYFIKNSNDNWNINYVMLVGGKDIIPVRYSHCPSNFPTDEDKFISDLYYADIYDENGSFCSWDSNNNNIFGEIGEEGKIDNVDLYPDVYIGRVLCSISDEVDILINKIIEYENNVYGEPWLDNIVLCGGDTQASIKDELMYKLILFSTYDHMYKFAFEGEYICEEISKIMNENNATKCYASGFLRSNTQGLTIDNINNAINMGCKFFVFSGHGSPYSFSTHPPLNSRISLPLPLGYIISNIQQLENENKFPITIFNCCLCANFDEVSDPIAWEFVNYENGGSISSLACTTFSWETPTTYTSKTYNGFLTVEIFKSYKNGIDILGELWAKSISDYLDDKQAMSSYMSILNWIHYVCLEEWILLGDPTLKIGGYNI
jgi:hypothetical protein